jgi:phosphopantothenoylcysteine decarboxylase/phosphopantothenate--cysteine ligase
MLRGKKIVLGVTGGIAAYKSAELTRAYVKSGAGVSIIMTKNATEFISPLTLGTLSGNTVYVEIFALTEEREIGHISLAERTDIVVVAPATANIIGKVASGIADDLLSTTIMATGAPVLMCPAMNTNMYENPIVRANMDKLSAMGYFIMDTEHGELACKTEGSGRLPSVERILEETVSMLTVKDFKGETILVSAGPTQELIDPVRYITNHSSGKMGYAIAKAARRRGAAVILVSGPTSLPIPDGVTFISVSSAMEMKDAIMEHLAESSIVIKAAAVADYRPLHYSESKIKKGAGQVTIEMEKNPDILYQLGTIKGDKILVGFAMETEDLVKNATDKMIGKNTDLIVANDLAVEGAGFRHDTNVVKIIDRQGEIDELPLMNKEEVAGRILDRIKEIKIKGAAK